MIEYITTPEQPGRRAAKASSAALQCRSRPRRQPERYGAHLPGGSYNRRARDLQPAPCPTRRVDQEAQNEWSRARNREPFHSYGYAQRKYRRVRSTMSGGIVLAAACAGAMPAPVAAWTPASE